MEDNNQNSGVSPELQQPTPAPYDNHLYDEPPKTGSSAMAIAALVMGILSLVCCCVGIGVVFGIVGLILGIISMKKNPDSSKGMAIAAIVMSGMGILCSLYMIMSFAVMATQIDWSQIDLNDMDKTQRYLEELERSMQYFFIRF